MFVFDISQTDGQELPELAQVTGEVIGYGERLFKFVESQNVELIYSEDIAPAKGLSHGRANSKCAVRQRGWRRVSGGR